MGGLALGALALACATPSGAARPPPDPGEAAGNAEPIPPKPTKKAVIVPSDVNLGPGPAGPVNTGTAGPPITPSGGTPSAPN